MTIRSREALARMLPRRYPKTIRRQGGEEAQVEVNQRALIDKVLARYSGEFTLFRELLQNADDAQSSAVEIHFETAAFSKQNNTLSWLTSGRRFTDAKVVQWVFKNNGKLFDDMDWERLPRIAEGNPNPEKIGAFGVGFYSLFSVTESPCVSSGDVEMRFYWKENDNQLYRLRSLLRDQDPGRWSTFKMPLREPGPVPPLLDLMRFLASSITFTVHIRAVDVFLDGHRLGHINKSTEPSQTINILDEMKTSSPEGIMRVRDVQFHRVAITVGLNGADTCSGVNDSSPMGPIESRVDLTVFNAEVDVTVDEKTSRELHRCTKKQPPSHLRYGLIYTGKEEYDRSSKGQRDPLEESIFQGLRADLEGAKHTRIFIGHATGQTTGIGGHMASRFVPTVERESIDFVDSYVSAWNKELLYVGGFLCRVVYELELANIQHLWEEAVISAPDFRPSPEVQDDLQCRFLHVLKFFSFHHSTPSPKVAQTLRDSFYISSISSPRLLSSVGVRAASDIRVFDEQVVKFLNTLPMLSERVALEAAHNIETLPDAYKVSAVTVKDVLQALDGHPLSEEELIFCLQWWLGLKRHDSSLKPVELSNAVTFNDANGTLHSLTGTEYFIDTKSLGAHIPHDGPLPASLIPRNISKHFTSDGLGYLGWRELTIIDWFRYISPIDARLKDPIYDFAKSPNWAERVLYTLSRAWPTLSEEICHTVKAAFECDRCIPTSHGLHRPDNSYLPVANDTLFRKLDLPVVTLTTTSKPDKDLIALLLFIGVQTRIPLELLSDRMLGTGEWSISDFIDYLVRLSPPLTAHQVNILKSSKLFTVEGSHENGDSRCRYRADELYPPMEIFRQLRLPVIQWDKKSRWMNDSDEAELLYRLGLHPHPPLDRIIGLCTTSVSAIAFKYFCDNLRSKYSEYKPGNFRNVVFVPAENKEETCFKGPEDVFLDARWKALGFSIVQSKFLQVVVSELGIRQHPPRSMVLNLLETTRPPDEETARQWYECLSEYIPSFTQSELLRLSGLKIVPTSFSGTRKWQAPAQCYLGPPTDKFFSQLFIFVDFGIKANHFLSACGSMKEPSVEHVAESLVHDPDRFYKLAEGHGGFLEKLRDLAARRTHISNDTLKRMSSQPILLGERQERVVDHVGSKIVNCLRTPKEIFIIDDSRDYALFSDAIFVAPRDELLERFYSSLGCRRLSKVIHERYEDSLEVSDANTCSGVRTLILQRIPLFLQKCSLSRYDKMRVPTPDNFSVVLCERLLVHKTLSIGDEHISRKQDLWAVAKYSEDGGKIELWLSRSAKRDMYDLAASLCQLLFGTVEINNTLLLGTMLSDLELLRRAGFDIDQFPDPPPPGLPENSDELDKVGAVTAHDSHPSLPNLNVNEDPRSRPAPEYIHYSFADILGGVHDMSRMVKGRLISSFRLSTPSEKIPSRVIRQSDIRAVVKKATEVSNSGGSRLLGDKDGMMQFIEHHSCNDFQQIMGFQSLGMWENVEFHVFEGLVPDVDAFIERKRESLTRFVHVITPAVSAHNLSMRSLHIFYDAGEGPIACNWERRIYLNLRYFEEWHDDDVRNGHLRRAQLSWFFVLAHEIAHNLTPLHDSAHEFWFSAICEAHISELFAMIS